MHFFYFKECGIRKSHLIFPVNCFLLTIFHWLFLLKRDINILATAAAATTDDDDIKLLYIDSDNWSIYFSVDYSQLTVAFGQRSCPHHLLTDPSTLRCQRMKPGIHLRTIYLPWSYGLSFLKVEVSRPAPGPFQPRLLHFFWALFWEKNPTRKTFWFSDIFPLPFLFCSPFFPFLLHDICWWQQKSSLAPKHERLPCFQTQDSNQ